MSAKKYNKIVVVDYTWGGHIPTYHKYICLALVELGYKVCSISPDPEGVEKWLKAKAVSDIDSITFHNWSKTRPASTNPSTHNSTPVNKPSLSLKQVLIKKLLEIPYFERLLEAHETWRGIQSRIAEVVPNYDKGGVFVMLPFLENKLLRSGYGGILFKRAFTLPWSGIFLHPVFFRVKGESKSMLNAFKAPTCRSVAILDEGIMNRLEEAISKPVIQFPDITNNELDANSITPLAKQILQVANGRKIISLLGVINNKKNILTLIEAIKLSEKKNLPLLFLIAGENNRYYWKKEGDFELVNKAIEECKGNSFWYLQALADGHEYNSLVAISDVIMASYQQFYHSSNTLTKAALFHKPLIVSKGYLMEERILKYKMGIAIDDRNPEMLLAAVEHLVKGQDMSAQPLRPEYDAYYEMHTYKRLKQALVEMIV